MALVRWQPTELFDLRNEMNRIFDPFRSNEPAIETSSPAAWRPSVDIAETQNEYLITADLPGINREDLTVTVTEGRLTLRGERRQASEEKNGSAHRVERLYGTFSRAFDLPGAVNVDGITAIYQDGVLAVTVPKAEEAKPKQIEVKISA
ncbi:MAG: Hsp20/alpha crystallin family protein [bacterium]|nr:Hsp20/alpha crystallin family protein [bacterium]